MKKYILPFLAASTVAVPAIAAPTITFNNGGTALPSYTTAQVFEDFETPAGAAATGTPFVLATKTVNNNNNAAIDTATETGTGITTLVYPGTVPGTAVQPLGSTNQFLAIEANGIFTVTFASPVQFFSFIIGSIDTYNNVKLVLSDGTTVGGANGLSGQDIVGLTNIQFNSNGNSSVAGRVSYDFGGGAGLKSAIFSSTRSALEIDGLAAAVPEAATWAMMMIGLGIVGGTMRRRTKVAVRFAAA